MAEFSSSSRAVFKQLSALCAVLPLEGEGDVLSNHSLSPSLLQYYTVPGSASIQDLMSDALILARNDGYDVFNALNLLEVSNLRIREAQGGAMEEDCTVYIQ